MDVLFLFTNLICSGVAGNAMPSGLPAPKETLFTFCKVTVSDVEEAGIPESELRKRFLDLILLPGEECALTNLTEAVHPYACSDRWAPWLQNSAKPSGHTALSCQRLTVTVRSRKKTECEHR